MDKELLKELEKVRPLKIYKIGRVVFSLYQAKNLFQPNWQNKTLFRIVKIARRAYLRYGSVPLTDDYDKDAAVYLCRAEYQFTEEWLCLRFVPGSTGANHLEDLNYYFYKGKSIAACVKAKLFLHKKDFKNKLVAISRICGIAPYAVKTKHAASREKTLGALKYTAQSFALINREFFLPNRQFTYLVSVFRPELLDKILHLGSRMALFLPPAYKILSCRPEEIRLNRRSAAYRFPGYFLNIFDLLNLLDKLIKEKKLSVSSVRHYAPAYAPSLKREFQTKKYAEILQSLKGLSGFLSAPGKIFGSALTGRELRRLAGKYVGDGPVLKIIAVSEWKKQLVAIKFS